MAPMNPFDILGADDNDDPAQLLAAAAVAKQKAEAKKAAAAATALQGAQPAPAKLPTKPAPPAQAVRKSRGGGAPSRGGFGRGAERVRARGGRGYGQNREFSNEDANEFQGVYSAGSGARAGGEEGERGARPPYRVGVFRRVAYRDVNLVMTQRGLQGGHMNAHSGTGRGYEMKREVQAVELGNCH
uniref:STM1-like N-terminal domain-containing protein n=1 Tax=Zoysia matrella TaxID=38722 RepID=A0A0C4MMD7_9POAL|nr:hypothetical protein [Zoysia matrella]